MAASTPPSHKDEEARKISPPSPCPHARAATFGRARRAPQAPPDVERAAGKQSGVIGSPACGLPATPPTSSSLLPRRSGSKNTLEDTRKKRAKCSTRAVQGILFIVESKAPHPQQSFGATVGAGGPSWTLDGSGGGGGAVAESGSGKLEGKRG
ncbi:unnamed protein product [Prorocentrum cordatum]|uniref:Uncharacterized protein n=1 Tax=Prorocentrum cordatum TaxID=2364126 RepID=A0ABN9U889_9DINO|nr:unnamed protein product [Polarella glacialis]